jgi:hypothetical protein
VVAPAEDCREDEGHQAEGPGDQTSHVVGESGESSTSILALSGRTPEHCCVLQGARFVFSPQYRARLHSYFGRSRQPGGPMHRHGPHVVTPSLITQSRMQPQSTFVGSIPAPPTLKEPPCRKRTTEPPEAMPSSILISAEVPPSQPHLRPATDEKRRTSFIDPIHSLQCWHFVASECTCSLHIGHTPP